MQLHAEIQTDGGVCAIVHWRAESIFHAKVTEHDNYERHWCRVHLNMEPNAETQ